MLILRILLVPCDKQASTMVANGEGLPAPPPPPPSPNPLGGRGGGGGCAPPVPLSNNTLFRVYGFRGYRGFRVEA